MMYGIVILRENGLESIPSGKITQTFAVFFCLLFRGMMMTKCRVAEFVIGLEIGKS